MKLFLFVLMFVLAIAGAASAQNNNQLVSNGYQTADNIARHAPYLSLDQANHVDRLLTEINQIVLGGSPVVPRITCVSRDNDNSRPYIVAIEKNPANVIRQPSLLFDSEAECLEAVNRSRMFASQNFSVICSSRDNDGRDPWKLSKIDLGSGTVAPLARAITSSKTECFQQVQDMREYTDGFSVCVSRDGDGRDPWKLMMFFFNGTSSTRPEDFSRYEDCKRKL